MKAIPPRVCYDDLAHLPEDGPRYELFGGTAAELPTPFARHQIVRQTIWSMLNAYARRVGGFAVGGVDVVLSDYDVVMPDVIHFSPQRSNLVNLDQVIRHAPDLCVEVLSPLTASTDRGKKMQMYARYGVRAYWIVDPLAESIETYELGPGGYELMRTLAGADAVSPSAMPGLTFTAASLFPER